MRAIRFALICVSCFMVAEVVVGGLANSLALLSDAGHMLSDIGGLAAALVAGKLARRPAQGFWTFGWARAEILSAAVNGITLLVVAAVVSFEGVERLIHPGSIGGWPLVIVGLLGMAVNLAASRVLHQADRGHLHVEGAYRHVLADMWAFVATVVAGIVILASGFRRADPIAALVVVVLMLRSAVILLGKSGRILLQAAPDDIDLKQIRAHLLDLPGVVDAHDLHVWTLTSRQPVLSAHIVVEDSYLVSGRAGEVLDGMGECLAGHFDVEHCTFQLEPAGHAAHEKGQHA